MHFHDPFDLAHGIEIDTNHDDQGCTSEQHSNGSGEVEELLYDRRYERNEGKEESSWENDTIENLSKVLLQSLGSDSRNRSTIFSDLFGHLNWVQTDLSIEKSKSNDQQGVDHQIGGALRVKPIRN